MWTNIIDIMIKVKPFLALIIAALFIGITSCSKKESIELQPKTQDTPPTPPPPLADTLDLFIAKAWVRTKVYKNLNIYFICMQKIDRFYSNVFLVFVQKNALIRKLPSSRPISAETSANSY